MSSATDADDCPADSSSIFNLSGPSDTEDSFVAHERRVLLAEGLGSVETEVSHRIATAAARISQSKIPNSRTSRVSHSSSERILLGDSDDDDDTHPTTVVAQRTSGQISPTRRTAQWKEARLEASGEGLFRQVRAALGPNRADSTPVVVERLRAEDIETVDDLKEVYLEDLISPSIGLPLDAAKALLSAVAQIAARRPALEPEIPSGAPSNVSESTHSRGALLGRSTTMDGTAVRRSSKALSFFSGLHTTATTAKSRASTEDIHRQAAAKRPRHSDAKTWTRSVQKDNGPALFPPSRQPGTLPTTDDHSHIPLEHGNVGRAPLPKVTKSASGIPTHSGSNLSPKRSSASSIARARTTTRKSPARVSASPSRLSSSSVGSITPNPDALVSEWTNAVERLMSTSKLRSADVFRRFDKNNDGRLSKEEFASGIEVLKLDMRFEDAIVLFNRFKASGDSFLYLPDFTRLVSYKHASDLPPQVETIGIAPVSTNLLQSVGQPLNLEDLTVDNSKTASARERARAVLQLPRGGSSSSLMRSSCGPDLLAKSNSAPHVSLELSTLSANGQERLLETLVSKDADLASQHRRAKAKLAQAKTTRTGLISRTAAIEDKKSDMAGQFGSEAAKINQGYRKEMKSLAAQIVQVDEEIVECNADLLRIQGALTQVNDMAESVGELQASGGPGAQATDGGADDEAVHKDLLRQETTLVATLASMKARLATAEREETACAARIADTQSKLTSLSGSFSSHSANLKQQHRDDIRVGQSTLKTVTESKGQLERDMTHNQGALKQVQHLLGAVGGPTEPTVHAHRPSGQPILTTTTTAAAWNGGQPTDALRKFREVLAELEPEISEKQRLAQASHTVAENQLVALDKQLASKRASLKKLVGRVGMDIQRSKHQARQDILALEVQRTHASDEGTAAKLRAREADGAVSQHRDLADFATTQWAVGGRSNAGNDVQQHIAEESAIRAELIRMDATVVDKIQMIEVDLAETREREDGLASEVADASASLSSASGSIGTAKGRLRKTFQDQLLALETRLRDLQARNVSCCWELHFNRGREELLARVQHWLDETQHTPLDTRATSQPPTHPTPVALLLPTSKHASSTDTFDGPTSTGVVAPLTTLRSAENTAAAPALPTRGHGNVGSLTTVRSGHSVAAILPPPNGGVDMPALTKAQRESFEHSIAPLAAQVGSVSTKLDELAQSNGEAHQIQPADAAAQSVLFDELRHVREELAMLHESRGVPPLPVHSHELHGADSFRAPPTDASYRGEAALIKTAAEHDARSIRSSAELEAKILRDNADRDARMAREMADRERHSIVEAAQRDANDIVEKAKRRCDRDTEAAEDRLARINADEEAVSARLKQLRKEQSEMQTTLMTSRVQLNKDTEGLLAEERDRLQEQANAIHASLQEERDAFEAQKQEDLAGIASQYEHTDRELFQARENLEEETRLRREAAMLEAEEIQRVNDEDFQARASTWNAQMEVLKLDAKEQIDREFAEAREKSETLRKSQEDDLCLERDLHDKIICAELEKHQNTLEERHQQVTQHLEAEEGRLLRLAQETDEEVHRKLASVDARQQEANSLIATKHTQEMESLQHKLDAMEHVMDAKLAARDAAAHSHLEAELEIKRAQAEAEIARERADAHSERDRKSRALEEEMKLLYDQVQNELGSSEEGTEIFRLHTAVKNAKNEAYEARKAQMVAEAQLTHMSPDLEDRDAQILQLESRNAALSSENEGIELRWRQAVADADTAEVGKTKAEVSLREQRSQLVMLEEELSVSRATINTVQDERNTLREQHDMVLARLAEAERDLAVADTKLRDLSTVHTLTARLEQASDESQDELKRALGKAHTELSTTRLEASVARDQASATERELRMIETSYRDQADRLAALEQLLHTSAADLLQARNRVVTTEEELDRRDVVALERARDKDRDIHTLRCKVAELEETNHRITQDVLEATSTGVLSGMTTLGASVLGRTMGAGRTSSNMDADPVSVVAQAEATSLRADLREMTRERDALKSQLVLEQRKRDAAEADGETNRVAAAHLAVKIKGVQQELAFANESIDEKRAAIAARDKAAAAAQQSFVDATRKIRGTADKDVRAIEEVARVEKAKSRNLQSLVENYKQDREAATQNIGTLEAELRTSNDTMAKVSSQYSELSAEHKGAVATHVEQLAKISKQLHEKTTEHTAVAAEVAALQEALAAQNAEAVRLGAELEEEKFHGTSGMAAGKEETRRVLDMMKEAQNKCDALHVKLDEAHEDNARQEAELAMVAASSQKVAVQLEQSRRDTQQLGRKNRGYMSMWATTGTKNAELRSEQQEVRNHLLDLRARELATAGKLDELAYTNQELQQSLMLGQDNAATLRDRINRVEAGSSARDGHLEAGLSESRLYASSLANKQSQLHETQTREVRDANTAKDIARERRQVQARERDHARVMEAYMNEVGDQRCEIDGLRSQLGAAQASSMMGTALDAGSLHSSVLAL